MMAIKLSDNAIRELNESALKPRANDYVSIGYWSHKEGDDTGLPFPVAHSEHDLDIQSQIIQKLKIAYKTGTMRHYRGWSTCRLCKRNNGGRELEVIKDNVKYRIPEGYLHYLTEHFVEADRRLLEIL
jgi:hypothetical protein